MTNTAWLPKALRWLFAIMSFFSGVFAVSLIGLMVIDPTLPANHQFGPFDIDISGQPGSVSMLNSNFTLAMLNDKVVLKVMDAGGLIELLKHYGLPLLILNAVFCAVLFDLMRRMFRNVGRGESFTLPTVRLVQIIGVSLLVFSLVSAMAESWFHYALFGYLAQHATIAVSGTPVNLESLRDITISSGGPFPFGNPVFFTGLLVLALSEVFRQGLVLKRENDLTV